MFSFGRSQSGTCRQLGLAGLRQSRTLYSQTTPPLEVTSPKKIIRIFFTTESRRGRTLSQLCIFYFEECCTRQQPCDGRCSGLAFLRPFPKVFLSALAGGSYGGGAYLEQIYESSFISKWWKSCEGGPMVLTQTFGSRGTRPASVPALTLPFF